MVCSISDKLIDSYDRENKNFYDSGSMQWIGQAFAMGPVSKDLSCAKFVLEIDDCMGFPVTFEARLYACSGTPGTDGIITGAPLAVSQNTYSINKITGETLYEFGFDNYTLEANTNYCIVVFTDSNFTAIDIACDIYSPTHAGNLVREIAPGYRADRDCIFYIYHSSEWEEQLAQISR